MVTVGGPLYFALVAGFLACGAASCIPSLCQGCDEPGQFDQHQICKDNCEKGTGKCLPGKEVDAGAGKDGKSDEKMDCKNPSDKGKDDKNKETPACKEATSLAAPSGTTRYSTSYNIKKASGNTFTEDSGTIVGLIPDGAGPFPLFMWMPGTAICPVEVSAQYQAQGMAARGFVSVAVQYPGKDTYEGFNEKALAVSGANAETALSVLCAHAKVNCSLGVAVGGYSQGTHIAALAAKNSDKITAVYMVAGGRPTSTPSDHALCDEANIGSKIPKTKRRYITGEGDQYFAWLTNLSDGVCTSSANAQSNLKLASGYDCDSKNNCLQVDGSGYYVATTTDTGDANIVPDHFNWLGSMGNKDVSARGTKAAAWFEKLNGASLDWLAQASKTSTSTTANMGQTSSSSSTSCACCSFLGSIVASIILVITFLA